MPRRSARSAGGDAPKTKKSKQTTTQIDGKEVRFEWEGDGTKWIQYSKALNRKIAEAYESKKKQVEVEVAVGIKMKVVFDQMVQENKKSGYQRRLRVAIKDDNDDEFKVFEWEGDGADWNPYDIATSFELEKALKQKKASLKTPVYDMNLKKLVQTNRKTKMARNMRWENQDSEAPPDDDDENDKEEEEEEEEEEVKPSASSGRGKSSSKSGKAQSGKADAKSTIRTVVTKKGKAPVDPSCSIASHCSVYEAQGVIWDCMLNQTNISNNNNKFYLIQVLKKDGKEEYYCWQRWGRVGYDGQNNLDNCGSNLQAAMTLFEKKFSTKTGNKWNNRNTFDKIPGKYDLLKMDYNTESLESMEDDQEQDGAKKEEDEKVPDSKLDKRVQDIIQLMCDIKSMEDQIVEMKYDTKKAPLGKLTKDQVKAGYTALKEIETLINAKDFGNNLREACSDFYTRIPHVFGMQVPPLIRSPQDVRKKLQLLEALEDIEIAIKLLKGGDMSENPVDRHYHQLKCSLEPLDKTSDTFKMLDRYLQSTHASTHMMYKMALEEVFEVDKEGDSAGFKDYGNRMLLWHGSRLTNWAGILGQGLRIAPPEAPVTGYMFGKGVYFADMSSKSTNYCFATKTRPTGVVVLCDVSLGGIEEKLQADPKAATLPAGKNSVKGLGRMGPDEKTHETMPDGMVVPIGKETKVNTHSSKSALPLNYNEYIVYDTSQIKMKYLLKVKFHFK